MVAVQVAVLSSLVSAVPLVAVAVMVAVPAATAVTTPSATVATVGSLVVHVTGFPSGGTDSQEGSAGETGRECRGKGDFG